MNKSTKPDTFSVRIVSIDDQHQGQRIDNFLTTLLKGVPKTYIYRILRKGEVRVNKGRVKPEYRLNTGDQVRIPPVRTSAANTGPSPDNPVLRRLENSILYEDGDVIVLNKPAGIAVHGGSGVDFGVIEGMRVLFPKAKRLELVHRLDRDTSGCLLLAKKASILKSLHEQIRSGAMKKHYQALVVGRLERAIDKVDVPLKKFVAKNGERFVKVDREGKSATTLVKVERLFHHASLLSLELLTGRTHQIRVHCAHIGHPIIGDEKYGDEQYNQQSRTKGIKRLCLHARRLQFSIPGKDKVIDIVAPLDNAFQAAIATLEKE
ncbi:MAG: 23S rRNA pseudouridine(955/2504/2580) synthase RluC [Gammaproteobacteria bacterium]|nr:23S rRNA pseudouridine(955/2504/2580) synthase RluC [Gammaproteobacteria bacterium]